MAQNLTFHQQVSSRETLITRCARSPNFPAQTWGRVRRFWRAHMDVDFNALCRLANREVVGIRTGRV